MKQNLLTQAGQDQSPTPPLAAGDRGTLSLGLTASPKGRLSWGTHCWESLVAIL